MTFFLAFHSPFQQDSKPTASLHDIVLDARLIQYAILAAFALQVYDYITSLDEEIRLIWCRRTPGCRRLLFLLNRYPPFLTAFSATYFLLFNSNQSYCRPAHFVVGELALAGTVIAEWTLFLRTCAICSSRVITVILMSLAVITTVGTAFNTFYYIDKSLPLDIGVPHRGCLFWYRLRIEWLSLVALIFCESVAFCLLLAKTIRIRRHSKSNIMMLICKDSIYYFIWIIGSSVVNLLIQLFASSLLCDALLIPQSVLHQILCTHFILRIRRLSEEASGTIERPPHDPSRGPWCENGSDL